MGQAPSTPVSSPDFIRREIFNTGDEGRDFTADIPDECLAGIFQFLSSVDRKSCSAVCRRWLRVDGENRQRLSLNAQEKLLDAVSSLFSRFDSVMKLALRCDRKSTSINDDALILISLRCRNLVRLKLRGCREITELGMASVAKNCKNLKKLSCGSCAFGAKGIYAFVNHCTVLEEVSVKRLRGVDIDNDVNGAKLVPLSVTSSSLKSICLKELVNGHSFAPLIIGSKKLETLKLIRCLGDWDMTLEIVGKLNSGLVEIHLEKVQVSDVGLLGVSKCSRLESLHLVKTPECFDVGLCEVAERCKVLKKLHIDGWRTNRIGDCGLMSVAKHCLNLQELVLISFRFLCLQKPFATSLFEVLVDIIKLAQKRGLRGDLGGWKEFLNSHDKRFGVGLSDPSKRSHETLTAFLKTFSKEEDLKFFDNIMRHHSNQYMLGRLKDKSHNSPEQRLVQVTLQHPLYPLDYSFSSIDEGWIVVNLKNKPKVLKSTAMVAVDCEMVLCEDGTEALVKVCVVDHNLEVKLNELVKPDKEIKDYRTEITGVSSQDLKAVTCSLADVQKSMKKLLSNGTILVGHSLHNDLRVLKVDHVRVIDTSYIFQSSDGSIHKRPSLNSLCQAVLGHEVREKGAPHNCLDDACAAMNLVLAKIKHGVDREFPIQLVQEHVQESEMAKLLLHKIPNTVNNETLHKIVPGDFKIELKPSRNGQGKHYSALAIFKNPQAAEDAYENVQGSQLQDTYGHPQKLVTYRLSTGRSVTLFVRKMATDEPSNDQTPSKRALQLYEAVDVSKKAKIDPKVEEDAPEGFDKCDVDDAHLKEIEALNQQLRQNELEIESLRKQLTQKDFEITMLNRMVSTLQKRKKIRV